MAIADKLFLTVKLGYAVLSFYSSPWIKLWNAQQISFLAEYEFSSHPGDWSPHLMTLVTSNNCAAPNNGDIYRFGLLLFEIAGVSSSALQELRMGFERLENTPHPWPVGTVNSINALIQIESRKLMMIFGKFLKDAVQDCFEAYFALAQNSGNPVYETKMFELRRRFERLEEKTRDSYEDLL
ncbi:Protein of unknown function [Pyronema omphalodes CBS 100304]|uniref:Uncharacterized protein n=1 Tax=Pyronema omphalodes (strain CBS 100304) TaxID=1076935 RepID=U4LPU5_PYROM|nr:Protein of unknown function [Pyronema omphalodes CBS 100304]